MLIRGIALPAAVSDFGGHYERPLVLRLKARQAGNGVDDEFMGRATGLRVVGETMEISEWVKKQCPDWQEQSEAFLLEEIKAGRWAAERGYNLFTNLRCHTCGKRLNSDVMFANICPECYVELMGKK